MRLPDKTNGVPKKRLGARAWAACAVVVAACLPLAGTVAARKLPPPPQQPAMAPAGQAGPSADYPVMVGDPYSIGTTTFTPADRMNYDTVGYAALTDGQTGGFSAAHHTLPVPSYVEVTSLTTGHTIVVRIDRRGPMDNAGALIALAPPAAQALGLTQGNGAVRVRRVNPPENERALLRLGQSTPERMPTPKPLLEVLMRRLQPAPAAMAATPPEPSDAKPQPAPARPAPVVVAIKPKPAKPVPPKAAPHAPEGAGAGFAATPPAAPDAPKPAPHKPEAPRAVAAHHPTKPAAPEAEDAAPAGAGSFTVQLGAFSSRERAEALAKRAGGKLSPHGAVFRVRLGSYASRPQAEAALAKARSAGYSEARIQRAD